MYIYKYIDIYIYLFIYNGYIYIFIYTGYLRDILFFIMLVFKKNIFLRFQDVFFSNSRDTSFHFFDFSSKRSLLDGLISYRISLEWPHVLFFAVRWFADKFQVGNGRNKFQIGNRKKKTPSWLPFIGTGQRVWDRQNFQKKLWTKIGEVRKKSRTYRWNAGKFGVKITGAKRK